MISLRLAWREIRNNRRFTIFFILNLALGLLGFVTLDTFKVAIHHSLNARSRLLLSADLAVSARRPLKNSEVQTLNALLPRGARESKLIEMYSMVSSGKSSRLVELAAIDQNYPFYGYLQLQDEGRIENSSNKPVVQKPIAWIYPELALQLGIKKGDSIKLGSERFQVGDFIRDDTGDVWRGFSLATRVYIGLPELQATHLIRKGSTAYYSRLFRLPPGTKVEHLARLLNRKLTDPAIQIRTPRNASEEIGRLLAYLNDYLGLVALVALFLAGIGAAYLFRSFLSKRTRDIAILTSLGISPRLAQRIYLIQLGLLGILSATLACGICAVALPWLGWVASPYLPYPIKLHLTLRTALIAVIMGSFGSILICYPILLKIRELKPSLLFQESAEPSSRFSKRQLAGMLPGLIILGGLSVWQAHSIKLGVLFFVAMIGSSLILIATGAGLLSALSIFERSSGFRGRTAIRNLRRSRLSSVSCFIAIGIGTLLLNLIPSVQKSLDTELARPTDEQRPSLFIFDIQEDQLKPLESYLRSKNVSLISLSPLIRSRLLSINGKPFEKSLAKEKFETREEERDARLHNRGFNLSYPTTYSHPDKIAQGKPFTGTYDSSGNAPAQVSLEHRFADRLGIHLGDILQFDVQGIPIRARVINFRKVKWTSFEPNFFILFQPGVLNDAPKTYIASIPRLDLKRKLDLQNGLVKNFPNISMIDVTDLVSKILQIFDEMSWALGLMAYLSLFAGFVVLFSIANHQATSRDQETNLLKVLGARFSDAKRIIQIEFALLGFCSSTVGVLLSYGVSYWITEMLFEDIWVFSWRVQLASIAGISILSVVTSMIATRRVLRQRPLVLLQTDLTSN